MGKTPGILSDISGVFRAVWAEKSLAKPIGSLSCTPFYRQGLNYASKVYAGNRAGLPGDYPASLPLRVLPRASAPPTRWPKSTLRPWLEPGQVTG